MVFERSVFRKVLRLFPDALHNPWIQFADSFGPGYACPDIVLPQARIILEAKLSYTPLAIPQIEELYLPLVEAVWPGAPWSRLIVVKYWKGPPPLELLSTLSDARAGETLPLMLA